MFQKLVNSIPDSTIFYVTIGGCILFPISAPIFIFTAMMVTCCKTPNFMDDEYNMKPGIRHLMLDGEINDSDIDKETDDVDDDKETDDVVEDDTDIIDKEPQSSIELVNEINKLKTEIDTIKCNVDVKNINDGDDKHNNLTDNIKTDYIKSDKTKKDD